MVWGGDNEANQVVPYEKDSPTTANYTISDTTLNNQSALTSVG